jgi:glycosyltransferase involved in cell wall biosynthesis
VKILYDYQIFAASRIGGASRYFAELIRHLSMVNGLEIDLVSKYSNNIHLEGIRNQKPLWFHNSSNFYLRKYGGNICKHINEGLFIKKLTHPGKEIIHPTYYKPYFLPYINRPLVITVLDMIHELFTESAHYQDATTKWKRTLCEKADRIIAISHSTKTDLVNLFGINPAKIRVIHLAGGFERKLEKPDNNLNLPENYILFVGARHWYKNFERFFQAILPLLLEEKSLNLVCTGPAFNKNELNLFERNHVKEQIVWKFVKEEDFFHLYNRALVFVFPSEYEGFGIPVLEAFSASCPVALSNRSSLPEVAGDAAVYFDPENIEDIRFQIFSIINDNLLRQSLIKKGNTQSKKFSWKRMAEETFTLYEEIY